MMKKLLLLLLPALLARPAAAQLLKPVVGPGTTFGYVFDLHGQHAPFELAIAGATDTLRLNWRIRGLAGGAYAVSPTAWQRADKLNFAQPTPGRTVRLPNDQTFMLLSKSAFAALVARHRYEYDHTVYELRADTAPLLLGGRPLDVLHVVALGDPTELWILNNPDFPVICQARHNPLGIDFVLTGIK
ncbi:hypothetical protein [Hymenobacter sp. BRD67]|uniref:hypothetical protein n=1 Tax=Hymenobacter sp. BRD67 TaxID=2675877 RepID=UPI001564E2C8|nr:hypothetical protein [Hymenobacter sp. BRD67]QKG54270.1 hypothetical protein GKZ67_18795 [Hymenobacter sp. BRD67]